MFFTNDDLFNNLINREPFLKWTQIDRNYAPDSYLISSYAEEDEDNIHVYFTIPGFEKDEISIEFEKKILTISSDIKEEHESPIKKSFSESKQLFRDVDGDNITATLDKGILQVSLPLKKKKSKIKID